MSRSVETREEHFVTFSSPGTFVSETTTKPIKSWDAAEAFNMALGVKERYGAVPFGFSFSTSLMTVPTGDIPARQLKELKRSGTYYIDGRLMTLDDVKRGEPTARILISNMERNKIARVVTGPVNGKGWRWTHPFEDGDTLLDADGKQVTP